MPPVNPVAMQTAFNAAKESPAVAVDPLRLTRVSLLLGLPFAAHRVPAQPLLSLPSHAPPLAAGDSLEESGEWSDEQERIPSVPMPLPAVAQPPLARPETWPLPEPPARKLASASGVSRVAQTAEPMSTRLLADVVQPSKPLLSARQGHAPEEVQDVPPVQTPRARSTQEGTVSRPSMERPTLLSDRAVADEAVPVRELPPVDMTVTLEIPGRALAPGPHPAEPPSPVTPPVMPSAATRASPPLIASAQLDLPHAVPVQPVSAPRLATVDPPVTDDPSRSGMVSQEQGAFVHPHAAPHAVKRAGNPRLVAALPIAGEEPSSVRTPPPTLPSPTLPPRRPTTEPPLPPALAEPKRDQAAWAQIEQLRQMVQQLQAKVAAQSAAPAPVPPRTAPAPRPVIIKRSTPSAAGQPAYWERRYLGRTSLRLLR